jgi:nucleoside transporter
MYLDGAYQYQSLGDNFMGFIKSRLGMMMFLQYAVWGIWLPLLGIYLGKDIADGGLGFSAAQIGWILGLAGSIGAISSPFIAGQLADRRFSTEKFLAALLVIGGIIKFLTAFQTSYTAWLFLSIAYSIAYMPTLALTNSLAFAHLKDPEKEFPYVRVFGTIGWIAVSWLFPMIWLQTDRSFQLLPPFFAGSDVSDATARIADALKVSGVLSIGYAAFCFMLPNTPPKKDSTEPLAFAKAFALLKNPSMLILVLASLPISIIHQIYFMQGGLFLEKGLGMDVGDVSPAMTVGQFAEIGIMAILGFVIKRFGFRITLALGGTAYFLRYAIWGFVASGEPSSGDVVAAVISQGLHGVCYACFFAAAYIYVDRIASDDIKNSAQTVFGIIILGIGPVFAGPVLGLLSNRFGEDGVITNYSGMWYALSVVALVTTILVWILFKDEGHDEPEESIEAEAGATSGTA